MIISLSYKIDFSTPVYGGGECFLSRPVRSIKKGDTCNTSKWELPSHIGTHVDFPYHFYENGQTIEDFAEEFWIIDGKTVQIIEIDLPDGNLLAKTEHIKKTDFNYGSEFVIVKTGFGKHRNQKRYETHNPGINDDFCNWILEKFKKIRIIGLDSVSISSRQHRDTGRIVHKKLLNPKKPVLIIEDMNLAKITSKTRFKKIIIAPVIVSKTDGAPCKIIADVEK